MLKLFSFYALDSSTGYLIAKINLECVYVFVIFKALQTGISHCLSEMVGVKLSDTRFILEETDNSELFNLLTFGNINPLQILARFP